MEISSLCKFATNGFATSMRVFILFSFSVCSWKFGHIFVFLFSFSFSLIHNSNSRGKGKQEQYMICHCRETKARPQLSDSHNGNMWSTSSKIQTKKTSRNRSASGISLSHFVETPAAWLPSKRMVDSWRLEGQGRYTQSTV